MTFLKSKPIGYALLAALLYGLSSPFSKLLLQKLPPTLMAALLYLGAGLGMSLVQVVSLSSGKKTKEAQLTQKELPTVIAMILLDIGAPILLMLGLTLTTASNASLLNNFEIVATSLFALFVFNENIGKRMWLAIFLITLSSILLSITDLSVFSFSLGSLFVLLACIAWGLENNCTRLLSIKDPYQIIILKGFGSGIGSLIISLVLKETSTHFLYIGFALLLGCFAYGFSIYFYIKAQRSLGAARTSALYAIAPFIGVLVSWVFLREAITSLFLSALGIMLVGTYLAASEQHNHLHLHPDLTYPHKHPHEHTHSILEHDHSHTEEIHHSHSHKK
jgi:drug/metabolite transporter (DMT)-like permease